MAGRAGNKTRHRRVQLQMVVLLLLFTLLTTLLTGWIIYDRTSEQVIRDTWQQQEALLRSACAAVNREIGQVKSFSWQLSNDTGVQRYLHLTEQTPKDILTKRGIIEKLQQMKAFSNTMADIGIYAEGMDTIVTGESSYRADDFYNRHEGITPEQMIGARSVPGKVALGRYAGSGTVSRILSTEPVLAFVSSLPLNAQTGKSYAFFHLNADRLFDCLPESEAGTLLLTDSEGSPVMPGTAEENGEISRQFMREKQNRLRPVLYGGDSIQRAAQAQPEAAGRGDAGDGILHGGRPAGGGAGLPAALRAAGTAAGQCAAAVPGTAG